MIDTATIASGSSNTAEICVNDGDVVDMVFVSGSYTSEISGTVYGTDGSTLGTFTGTSGSSWSGTVVTGLSDGVSYIDGETFYSETAMEYGVGGTDADDNDSECLVIQPLFNA